MCVALRAIYVQIEWEIKQFKPKFDFQMFAHIVEFGWNKRLDMVCITFRYLLNLFELRKYDI